MSTVSTCPSCDKKLRLSDDADGRKLRCPGCGTLLAFTEAGLVPFKEEVKPRKERSGERDNEDERPRRQRRRDEEDDEVDRPRRRGRKRQGGIPVWVWVVSGSALGIGIIGLVLILVLGGGGQSSQYAKIQKGMTEQQVLDLLGESTQTHGDLSGGNKSRMWVSGGMVIQVIFKDGKVKSKRRGPGKLHKGGIIESELGPPE